MTLIMADGFDDRANLMDGTGEGDYFTGWGLYNSLWDGVDQTAYRGVQLTGRYDSKPVFSLQHNTSFSSDLLYAWTDWGDHRNYIAWGIAFQSFQSGADVDFMGTISGSLRSLCGTTTGYNGHIAVSRKKTGGAAALGETYLEAPYCGSLTTWGWLYMSGYAGIGLGTGNDFMHVYINGNPVISATGLTLSQGYGGIRMLKLPWGASAVDDLYVYASNTPLAHYGELRSVALMPNGAGSNTQWTPAGAASNFQAVYENDQDMDTTYNTASAHAERDDFEMDNLSDYMSSGTVKALVQRVMAKADAGSVIRPYLEVGGTRYYQTTPAVRSAAYGYLQLLWETNPATGLPWTVAEVDSVKAGYETLVSAGAACSGSLSGVVKSGTQISVTLNNPDAVPLILSNLTINWTGSNTLTSITWGGVRIWTGSVTGTTSGTLTSFNPWPTLDPSTSTSIVFNFTGATSGASPLNITTNFTNGCSYFVGS